VSSAATPPSSAESGSGWYVYGVVPAAQVPAEAFAGARGVHPSGEIVLVADAELAAIASDVPLAEFGETAIAANLHDESWLEEKVRAHEAVLEAALARAPLVPFRFGTIYRSDEHVRRMLREHPDLGETLDRLRGTVELGVKAFLDVEEFDRKHGGDPDAAGEGGRAYMLRKQRDRRLTDARASFAAACARESHERLTAAAEDGRANPLRRPEVSGSAGQMILNGAYLVRAERQEAFEDAVAALQSDHQADGVRYELTGPWPAYNFVAVDPET
jgi:Gas vesicle synthesis protein GvpL/GvpF